MAYLIAAESHYGVETVDEAESITEARELVLEYRLAFGPEFTVYLDNEGGM